MKDWLVSLVDDRGRSHYVENGVVRRTAAPRPLPVNPGGFTDIAIGWERSLQELAVTRNFSASLQYHEDAALILRDYAYRYNIEQKLYTVLHKRELRYDFSAIPHTYGWHYAFYYRGEIDPTTIKHGGASVTASISEGGLLAKYKANRSTAYEVPLDGDPDVILVKMDGIKLAMQQSYIIPPLAGEGIPAGPVEGRHLVAISPTVAEGKAYGLYCGSAEFDSNDPTDFATDGRYFLSAGLPITGIRMQGVVAVFSAVDGTYGLSLVFSTGRMIFLGGGGISNDNPGDLFQFPFDVTFDMTPDERAFLVADVDTADASSIYYAQTDVTLSFKSAYPATYVKCLRPATLFKRLAGKVGGDEALAQSAILAGNEWPVITCGDALRGLPGSRIKTSLQQFADFAGAVLAAATGVEGGKLVVEPYGHFLSEAAPVDLGSVSGLDVTRATDQLVNTVKVGYEAQDIDNVNGRYEFNNTYTFVSEVTRVTKELTLVSPYLAQPYVIEITRINFDGRETTDNDNDNKTFLLDVDLDNAYDDAGVGTYYKLRRPPGTTITGVPDPDTIFNVGLSPKRLLARHDSLLASLFYGFAGARLRFSTTDRNRDLVTTTGSVIIAETADYKITGAPLFKPFYFDFDTEAPFNLAALMSDNPNRCFTFIWNGKPYAGFPIKVGIAPTDGKGQAFKLLCAPSTNLLNLVDHG